MWTAATHDFLDTVANRIESKFARAEPRVVASLVVWEKEKMNIITNIEKGMHARSVQNIYLHIKLTVHYKGRVLDSVLKICQTLSMGTTSQGSRCCRLEESL